MSLRRALNSSNKARFNRGRPLSNRQNCNAISQKIFLNHRRDGFYDSNDERIENN